MIERDPVHDRKGELQREIVPERDLWPDIARRIEMRPRRSSVVRMRIPLAAAAALALAAGVLLLVRARTQGPASSQGDLQGGAVVASAGRPAASAPTMVLPGEAEYLRAISSLESELARRREGMPKDTLAAVDRDEHVVDDAIASSRTALLAHPDDPELRDELDRAYQDKIDLLRETTELMTGI